ncbi:MAG: hypothetical protein AB7T59_19345 [Hyphomonadaceae bacterium]
MFGWGLSRFIPAPVRPQTIAVLGGAYRRVNDALGARNLAEKRKAEPTPFRGERVAIVGFIDAPTGLGRGARLMHEAMKRRGVLSATFDAGRILQPNRAVRRSEIARLVAFAPSDIVAHVNPPLMRELIRYLPSELVAKACLVGYWAWELNRLPQDWSKDAANADAIWTPSPFVADAVRASLPLFRGDIRVEPHAIELDPFPRADETARRAARARLGAPPGAFVVGYSFTMAANFARKNPTAAIAAFQRAFPAGASRPALLLLRCPDLGAFPPGHAELRTAAASDARIRLLDRDMAPLQDFYACLDVYLSLHRSEGYGLQLAEALQAGADVVATAWGLSPEIAGQPGLHAISSKPIAVVDPQGAYARVTGAVWAAPNIAQAAEVLAEIAARRV